MLLGPTGVSLAAGAVAGTAVEATLFPLDCLKTRAQSSSSTCLSVRSVRGLYRGVGTAVAGSAPGSAIFFMVYESSRQALTERGCHFTPLFASALGELAACSVRAPTDIVKQQLQMGLARDFSTAARGVVTNLPKVFASFRTTAMRDVMHSSLQMSLYESFKLVAAREQACAPERLPAGPAAICGSMAGCISAVLTTPIDVLRTRVNLRSVERNTSWKTMLAEEVRDIHRAKGAAGFFAGAGLRSASMGVGGFLFLGTFEFAKRQLSVYA